MGGTNCTIPIYDLRPSSQYIKDDVQEEEEEEKDEGDEKISGPIPK